MEMIFRTTIEDAAGILRLWNQVVEELEEGQQINSVFAYMDLDSLLPTVAVSFVNREND